MTLKKSLTFLTAAALLTACQSSPEPRPLPPISQPQQPAMNTVDGTWTDPNGLVSTFNAGRFDTRTTDGSNAVLASGSYTAQPNGIVEINLYSNLKKTNSRVNCKLADPSRLNCTAESGTQFTLTRRA